MGRSAVARTPLTSTRIRPMPFSLLVVYVGIVLVFTLGPRPGGIDLLARILKFAVDPSFDGTNRSALQEFGRRRVEGVANLLVFVPIGLLVPLIARQLERWAVPLAVAASVSIELTQYFVVAPRSPQMADVYWNTAGATCGFGLYLVLTSCVSAAGGSAHDGAGQRVDSDAAAGPSA